MAISRQQIRKLEREKDEKYAKLKRDLLSLQKLPKNHLYTINRICETMDELNKSEFMESMDRNLTAAMVEYGFTLKEVRAIQDKTFELSEEEVQKLIILEKENVVMAKIQAEVRIYMEGLIKEGKSKKEILEDTRFKFPKLSKSMINNAYGHIQDELETEDAAAYILEDNKKIKEEIKKDIKKNKKKSEEKAGIEELTKKEQEEFIQEVVKNIREEIENCEEVKEEKEMGKVEELEVLEEIVIKEVKLKGSNGVYNAKTGIGVQLENEGYKLSFANVEELESFCSEFKKVFARI